MRKRRGERSKEGGNGERGKGLHPAHMILQLQLRRSWVYTLLGCREEADEIDLAQVEQV